MRRSAFSLGHELETIIEAVLADLGKNERAQEILSFWLDVYCRVEKWPVRKRIPTLTVFPEFLIRRHPLPRACERGQSTREHQHNKKKRNVTATPSHGLSPPPSLPRPAPAGAPAPEQGPPRRVESWCRPCAAGPVRPGRLGEDSRMRPGHAGWDRGFRG